MSHSTLVLCTVCCVHTDHHVSYCPVTRWGRQNVILWEFTQYVPILCGAFPYTVSHSPLILCTVSHSTLIVMYHTVSCLVRYHTKFPHSTSCVRIRDTLFVLGVDMAFPYPHIHPPAYLVSVTFPVLVHVSYYLSWSHIPYHMSCVRIWDTTFVLVLSSSISHTVCHVSWDGTHSLSWVWIWHSMYPYPSPGTSSECHISCPCHIFHNIPYTCLSCPVTRMRHPSHWAAQASGREHRKLMYTFSAWASLDWPKVPSEGSTPVHGVWECICPVP